MKSIFSAFFSNSTVETDYNQQEYIDGVKTAEKFLSVNLIHFSILIFIFHSFVMAYEFIIVTIQSESISYHILITICNFLVSKTITDLKSWKRVLDEFSASLMLHDQYRIEI